MKKPIWKRYLDFWGRDLKREVEDEFDFHIEMRARELTERGVPAEEARRRASHFFGVRTDLRKECMRIHERQRRRDRLQSTLNHLLRDLSFAIRQLRTRQPANLTVLVILALGIGINSAVFSLVQSVLLQPLPYPEPQELIRIWDRNVESDLLHFSVSVPHFEAWKKAESLSSVGAYREDSFNLETPSGVESVRGVRVSAGLLEVLGVSPLEGRNLSAEDDLPGVAGTLMISSPLWQRAFAGKRSGVGSSLILDGRSYQVVGILPEDFVFPQQAGVDLLVPYQLEVSADPGSAHFLRVLGRLAPGFSAETATAELTRLAAAADQELGLKEEGWSTVAADLHEATVTGARSSLLLLMGSVAVLLLIGCCNLSGLYVIRGSLREKEFALRSALGASRWDISRQLLIEVLVVSLAGAGLGILLGMAGQNLLLSLLPADLPRRMEAGFRWEVAFFAFGLSLLCGCMVGLVQTRLVGRVNRPALNLRHARGASRRLTRVLVAAEVALSMSLLVASAILTQSFWNLSAVDPGFRWDGVSRASIAALASAPGQGPERVSFFSRMRQELGRIEGVEAAALVHRLPLDGNSSIPMRPRGAEWDEREPFWVNYRSISPDYFRVLRVSFQEGRDFESREAWETPGKVIVNRALAELFWPDQSGLGKEVAPGPQGPWLEVVGVVSNVREEELSGPPQPAAYIPYAMAPVPSVELLLRGSRSAADLNGAVPALMRELAPYQGMSPFRPLGDFMAARRAEPLARSFLVSTFAGLATALALLGVVGLVSAAVAGRMHELGVRLVLGATPSRLSSLAFGDGLLAAAAGIPFGLLLAWLGSGWLSSEVFGITATDPVTYLLTATILLLGAGLAAYFPSRRASRIDPMRVMNQE